MQRSEDESSTSSVLSIERKRFVSKDSMNSYGTAMQLNYYDDDLNEDEDPSNRYNSDDSSSNLV